MSNRFSIKDTRWTASAAGPFFTVQCVFVSDKYDEALVIRKESVMHSNSLPTGNLTVQAAP